MAPLKKQNIKSSSTSNKIEETIKKKDYDNDDSSHNSSDSDDNILNGSGSDSDDDEHDDSENDNNKNDDNNDENDDGEDAIGNDEEIDDEDEDEKEEDTEEDEESEESEEEEEESEEEEEEYEDKDDDCLYKFATHKSTLFEDDGDIDEANFFIDEENITTTRDVYISNDQRITKPVLTKYERVRILGERARQLSLGAKPMIKSVENIDPINIAHAELKMKVIPLIIIRTLPTGEKEKWKLNELAIIN